MVIDLHEDPRLNLRECDKKHAQEVFKYWIRETVEAWINEHEAWDALLEDADVDLDEEELRYIRQCLEFDLVINEKVCQQPDQAKGEGEG
jgi:hypothetical protein